MGYGFARRYKDLRNYRVVKNIQTFGSPGFGYSGFYVQSQVTTLNEICGFESIP